MSFIIYCSGNAGRVLGFYSNQKNVIKFAPSAIYYDGGNPFVISELREMFQAEIVLTPDDSFMNKTFKEKCVLVSEELLLYANRFEAEYIFCFGDKILKGDILELFASKIINFHPSILPAFKGLNAIDQALKSEPLFLGNTAHLITSKIDEGEIICQSILPRAKFNTYEDVLELQYPMFKLILKNLLAYKVCDEEIFSEVHSDVGSFLIEMRKYG